MKVELYIDILFLLQFAMLYVNIDIAGTILQWKTAILRKIAIAAGFSFGIVGYYIIMIRIHRRMTGDVSTWGIVILLMVVVAILSGCKKTWKHIIAAVLVMAIAMFVLAGGWYTLARTKITHTVMVMIIYAVVVDCICKAVYAYWKQERIEEKHIYEVVLCIQGKTIPATALYDTGNCLTEPYGRKPVIIAAEALLEKYAVNRERMIMVPYYSLGNQAGMIEAILAEQLWITQTQKCYTDFYVAIDSEILQKQNKYSLILHNSMI